MLQVSSPRRSPLPPQDCHLARAFDAIGDRWTLLILRSALHGVRRFDDYVVEDVAALPALFAELNRTV